MIAYLDTSALVPLLVQEPSSLQCRRLWDDADDVVSIRLAYLESAAALAQAKRLGRIETRAHRASLRLLDELWSQLQILEIDQSLAERAAHVADRYSLRGYDAVHCASAEAVNDASLVAGSGDKRLLGAWHDLGVQTYDTLQGSTT